MGPAGGAEVSVEVEVVVVGTDEDAVVVGAGFEGEGLLPGNTAGTSEAPMTS